MLRWLSLHAPEFDVFHVHYGRGIVPFLPVSLLLRRSATVFLQPHGMLDRTQGLRGWLDVCVTRRHLTRAARVFVLHPHEQAMILGIAPSARCAIVPKGVRLPEDLPAWQGPSMGSKTVLFLARLHPRKRVLTFISAARLLRSRRNDVRFRIVGPDGGDLTRARAQVRQLDLDGCIEFAGRVSQPEALREYAQADVYVLPTEDENFSISVLEALMVGTPSVVIRTTRNLDVLRAADAVEISAADPQAISLAVENLLDHPGLCLQRSRNGQKLIRDQLNIARVVDLLEAHYRQDVHP
jgi:glycosyltransferase involved in cell wall biosynthesis